MGLINSIKEALGGDHDGPDDVGATAPESAVTDAELAAARHVDLDAPAEDPRDAFEVTGGKHAARD